MKISEKQLLLLVQTLNDTLCVNSPMFSLALNIRQDLYVQIVNQQTEELKEVE